MKYYMVNDTDASGHGHTDYTYYALSDGSTLEDAEEMYIDENPWVKFQEVSRMRSQEIDLGTYNAGLAFNNYTKVCRKNDSTNDTPVERLSYHLWESHNMFPTKKWAEMFARTYKPVYVGYPKNFSVYKMDENRKLHFVYHYSTGMDFRDDKRLRPKFKTKWDK